MIKQLQERPLCHAKLCCGFALIATVSLMVLLVMIATAMLSLSTIELRSSHRTDAMIEAKANARMALVIALGDLQKYAGPDQRVTANGAILRPVGSGSEPVFFPPY